MGVMTARPPDAVLAELLALLPPGEYLARDAASAWAALLAGPAAALADAEASALAFAQEIEPGAAVALLGDYERVLGRDPCGRDLLALSPGDRQRLAASRWTGRGGQSPGYYIRLAETLGTTITIEEGTLFTAGASEAGDVLAAEGDQFAWAVTLPTSRVTDFIAGASEAGDALGTFQPNLCECVIRLQAPAHTTPVFHYLEPATIYDLTAALPPAFTLARASTATYFDADGVLQEAAANAARPDHDPATGAALGTLIEPASGNQIPNPRAEGAVAGMPGTMPSVGWRAGGFASGVATEVVGSGTEDGIPYVDVRWFGTASSGSSIYGGYVVLMDNTTAVATDGQAWTGSAYLRLMAGNWPAGGANFHINEYMSGGGLVLTGPGQPIAAPTNAALAHQRFSGTRTLNSGTTAYARLDIGFNIQSGDVIDFTLRIGAPQLEQQPAATSLMLPPPGSPAASSRAADDLSLALPADGFPGNAGWSAMLTGADRRRSGGLIIAGNAVTESRASARRAKVVSIHGNVLRRIMTYGIKVVGDSSVTETLPARALNRTWHPFQSRIFGRALEPRRVLKRGWHDI